MVVGAGFGTLVYKLNGKTGLSCVEAEDGKASAIWMGKHLNAIQEELEDII